MQDARVVYVLKRQKEIELFLARFAAGQISKTDETYNKYKDYLDKGWKDTQESVLKAVMEKDLKKIEDLTLEDNQELSNVAMLKAQKKISKKREAD